MFLKSSSLARAMGCCSCFGFSRNPHRRPKPISYKNHNLSRDFLLDEEIDYDDDGSYDDGMTDIAYEKRELPNSVKRSEEILNFRERNGLICRQCRVKETHQLFRSEDENGNRMINEYVRQYKIGAGSYGKVILYQSSIDGKLYAIKAFHKSHLVKQRVGPSETAMNDVLREVLIMSMVEHPNIVNLIEVIDDPNEDHFYMVLEYVDGKCAWDGSVPSGGLGESTTRKYLRDIVSGLTYLHAHNVVHLDIKPDNLLVTRAGVVKIGDFSVSQVFEDEKDELRRSPGTPVFTAPECCLGLSYSGKAADAWALGVTLYCMIMGQYPFLGDSLQDQYDKIVNNPLVLPPEMNLQLRELLEGLLCKDPTQRMTLDEVRKHAWVIGEDGPIPQYLCWCKRNKSLKEGQQEENGHPISSEPDGIEDNTRCKVTV